MLGLCFVTQSNMAKQVVRKAAERERERSLATMAAQSAWLDEVLAPTTDTLMMKEVVAPTTDTLMEALAPTTDTLMMKEVLEVKLCSPVPSRGLNSGGEYVKHPWPPPCRKYLPRQATQHESRVL